MEGFLVVFVQLAVNTSYLIALAGRDPVLAPKMVPGFRLQEEYQYFFGTRSSSMQYEQRTVRVCFFVSHPETAQRSSPIGMISPASSVLKALRYCSHSLFPPPKVTTAGRGGSSGTDSTRRAAAEERRLIGRAGVAAEELSPVPLEGGGARPLPSSSALSWFGCGRFLGRGEAAGRAASGEEDEGPEEGNDATRGGRRAVVVVLGRIAGLLSGDERGLARGGRERGVGIRHFGGPRAAAGVESMGGRCTLPGGGAIVVDESEEQQRRRSADVGERFEFLPRGKRDETRTQVENYR